MSTDTPMMQQWHHLKEQAKEALLLFRLGDFYEAFYQDAEIISKEIHLTLTQRQNIPMCGVPYHAFETYVDKLVGKGFKIAIAEQMEDPKSVKGIVKRKIVRVLSPGALTASNLLSEKKNNYLVTLLQIGQVYGLCAIDLSTSTCKVMDLEEREALFDELYRLSPAEIVLSKKFLSANELFIKELQYAFSFYLNIKEEFYFDPSIALEEAIRHFSKEKLQGFGIRESISIYALGALLRYAKEDLQCDLSKLSSVQKEELSSFMGLDQVTLTNLEIFHSSHGKKHSLLWLLDKSKTPMGARLLSDWIKRPLLSISKIRERYDAVEELLAHPQTLLSLAKHLEGVRDLERLLSKITSSYANGKDMATMRFSLEKIPLIKQEIFSLKSLCLQEAKEKLFDLEALLSTLQKALVEQPCFRLGEGETFQKGYSKELDELMLISQNSKEWIASYQQRLREEYGIKTLKVGYTKAFGYYIEISKGQAEKASPFFIRRQTLVNAERFVTEELKTFEYKILHAEEKKKAVEERLFEEIKALFSAHAEKIQMISQAIAKIDLFYSLAKSALEYNYVRPTVDESTSLIIKGGRHPIIERAQLEEFSPKEFTPNDCELSSERQLFLITGPNMAGKSTYIRQVALLVVLAQIGSFVPAESAHIGIVDKVFSRIGANDDLSRGQSTFMVEMSQTANILNNCTSRSLVILDEIGRGTSTYDGISIAWAVAEYLLTTEGKQAKTLFATHYWELTQLEESHPNACNVQVAVKESPSGILFLHKIIVGGTDRSYAIHVAKLAGLPYKVIQRAQSLLYALEKTQRSPLFVKKKEERSSQLHLFPSPHENVVQEIKRLQLDAMTPLQALVYLQEMKKKLLS